MHKESFNILYKLTVLFDKVYKRDIMLLDETGCCSGEKD